jgi:hypothetical protein
LESAISIVRELQIARGLKRQWPSELPQPADEKNESRYSPTIGPARLSSMDDFSTQDTYLKQYYSEQKKIESSL